MNELRVVDLGLLPYANALELQRDVARRRITGEIDEDVLLLVEHPPVVTLGRTAKGANLIASPELLASQGVELFEVERGGDITFHGPGQLVGYPIIDLKRHRKDLHWYLRQVEQALIDAIARVRAHGRARRAIHRRLGRNRGLGERACRTAKDRVNRRSRARLGHVARLRPEREHGPSLFRPHRAVWHQRRHDDIGGARARRGVCRHARDRDAVVRAFGLVFDLTPRSTVLPDALASSAPLAATRGEPTT